MLASKWGQNHKDRLVGYFKENIEYNLVYNTSLILADVLEESHSGGHDFVCDSDAELMLRKT